jgi:5-methylcytosine-specific restriction endonuclease McrA
VHVSRGWTWMASPFPVLCPHGNLGIARCKECKNERWRQAAARRRARDPVGVRERERLRKRTPAGREWQRRYRASLTPEQRAERNHRARQARRARHHGVARDPSITLMAVYERDRRMCWLCEGAVLAPGLLPHNDAEEPTIDHVVPISRGGGTVWSNVRLAHRGCNASKGDRDTSYPMMG